MYNYLLFREILAMFLPPASSRAPGLQCSFSPSWRESEQCSVNTQISSSGPRPILCALLHIPLFIPRGFTALKYCQIHGITARPLFSDLFLPKRRNSSLLLNSALHHSCSLQRAPCVCCWVRSSSEGDICPNCYLAALFVRSEFLRV